MADITNRSQPSLFEEPDGCGLHRASLQDLQAAGPQSKDANLQEATLLPHFPEEVSQRSGLFSSPQYIRGRDGWSQQGASPTRTPSNGACLTGHQPLPSTQQALSSLSRFNPVSPEPGPQPQGQGLAAPALRWRNRGGQLVPVLSFIILSAGWGKGLQ